MRSFDIGYVAVYSIRALTDYLCVDLQFYDRYTRPRYMNEVAP